MSFRKRDKIYMVFGLSLVILLGSLWWLQVTTTLMEPFNNAWTNMRSQKANIDYLETVRKPSTIQRIQKATYNPDVLLNDRSINIPPPNETGISSSNSGNADYSINDIVIDMLNETPQQKIKWDKVIVDTNEKNLITIYPRTSPDVITSDACSTKGMLNSNFKEDVCVAYAGNYEAINQKCQELTAENCKIPTCCVLLNGNMCVAGNQNGPIYLTDHGNSLDYKYYYHKDKCYGDCAQGQSYDSACSQYSKNSTGVSKSCMIQIFNNYGCPNSSPDAFINDDLVKSLNGTSKQYVDDYIQIAVSTIKGLKDKRLCYGPLASNPNPAAVDEYDLDSEPAPADSLADMGNKANMSLSDVTSF
jgi:hypothetical protein